MAPQNSIFLISMYTLRVHINISVNLGWLWRAVEVKFEFKRSLNPRHKSWFTKFFKFFVLLPRRAAGSARCSLMKVSKTVMFTVLIYQHSLFTQIQVKTIYAGRPVPCNSRLAILMHPPTLGCWWDGIGGWRGCRGLLLMQVEGKIGEFAISIAIFNLYTN